MYSIKDLMGFRVQFLWWGLMKHPEETARFVYFFPNSLQMPALYYGLYLGLFEVRLFNDHYTRYI